MSHQSLPRRPFQFRLAGLLWGITILASVAAIVAPYIRQWTASHWSYFSLGLLTFCLGAVVMAVLARLDQRQWHGQIRRLGAPVIRITNVTISPQPLYVRFYAQYKMLCILSLAASLLLSGAELHATAKLTGIGFQLTAIAGVNLVSAIFYFPRPAFQVFLGPEGLATQHAVYPWETIRLNTEDNRLWLAAERGHLLEVHLSPDEMAIAQTWHLAAKK